MELPLSNPTGFYFNVSFEGEDTAFQEVSGISQELNVEEIVGGGENRYKYRLPKQAKYENLVLKRGLIPSHSALLNWCKNTLDNGFEKPIITQNISVQLLDQEGKVMMSWSFQKAYPVTYSISDLTSKENALVVETIELAYTYFEAKPTR